MKSINQILNFCYVQYQCCHHIINDINSVIVLTLFALISLLRVSCNQYQHAGQYQHAVDKGNDLQIHLCAKNY